MKIYIKNISGETISLDDVNPETSIKAIILRTWMNRHESQKNVTLKDFVKAINLIYAGQTLDKVDILSMHGIKEGSTIKIVGKSWTMAPNFDWSTMTIPDHISGAPILEPYMLNPGCADVFEQATLQSIAEGSPQLEKVCPSCHDKIDSSHLARLSITKSFSSQNYDAVALEKQNVRVPKL